MNSNKKIWVALVVIGIIAIGGLFFPGVRKTVSNVVGAVSTLDNVNNPYVTIGGVAEYHYSQPTSATSSVVCSLKNPFGATSTLARYGVSVTSNGIGVAQTVEVSTSTTNGANNSTSSPAFIKALAVGAGQFSFAWNGGGATTSALTVGSQPYSTGRSDTIIGPSDYINFVISTATPSTFTTYYGGRCTGVLYKL